MSNEYHPCFGDRQPRNGSSSTTLNGSMTVDVRRGVVSVVGEIDAASAPTFAAALAPLVARGGHVRIDLRGVRFMGAAGVHVLDDAAGALADRGRVVLINPARPVERVVELVGGFRHLVDVESGVDADVVTVRPARYGSPMVR